MGENSRGGTGTDRRSELNEWNEVIQNRERISRKPPQDWKYRIYCGGLLCVETYRKFSLFLFDREKDG